MRMHEDSLIGGFADPVFDSQTVFRAVMDAMAQPGTQRTIAPHIKPPSGLGLAQGAIALTLCDHDVTVWLSSALVKASVGAWIGFHTGASMVDAKNDCQFAFLELGTARLTFSAFALGSQDYPDRSATLVLELPSLTGGPELVLQGPGIKDQVVIAPLGLPEAFVLQWQENHQQFPRGVDLVLTCGRDLLCLPRSCHIALKEA
ncbi:alpha-D-ribose 1-methylphosphonate 5-triphosphate synthase subunit PhnH [Agrobacterium vitis]|nr:alpha-D-ribose 1-methylphosphonate 5-triphosphate synthase subunit PhnH [Agrobacterium vitis]MBE1437236.1 alpha-D-ribose 1-methylphosphonate 5-triphosphate synthase subunit PhnH [Agrobacterium vitis]